MAKTNALDALTARVDEILRETREQVTELVESVRRQEEDEGRCDHVQVVDEEAWTLCPLMASEQHLEPCAGKRCAWWDRERGCCGIMSIVLERKAALSGN